MHIHLQNSVHICIMTGHRNKPQIILNFPTILIHSTPRILTNSSYRFNNTDVTFSQDHLQTLKMKSYQKLSPTSYLVGMVLGSILMLCHRVLITSPKLLTHGCCPEYLCASVLCHIHSATHWTQEVSLIYNNHNSYMHIQE